MPERTRQTDDGMLLCRSSLILRLTLQYLAVVDTLHVSTYAYIRTYTVLPTTVLAVILEVKPYLGRWCSLGVSIDLFPR